MTPFAVVVPNAAFCSFGSARQVGEGWAVSCGLNHSPWFLFQLDSQHDLDQVEVRFAPRLGFPSSVQVSISTDGRNWITSSASPSNNGRRWEAAAIGRARLVTVTFVGLTSVSASILFRGRLGVQQVTWGRFDHATRTYHLTHDAGFFSQTVVATADILALAAKGIEVANIDASLSYNLYRDDVQRDVHAEFYTSNLSISLAGRPELVEAAAARRRLQEPEQYGNNSNQRLADYHSLLAGYRLILDKFFNFSEPILAEADAVAAELSFDPSEAICIYYRGTDKAKEFALAPIERYIEACDRLLAPRPTFRVLVQSDEESAVEAVRRHYGRRSAVVPGVPTSTDGKPLHLGRAGGRFEAIRPFILAYLIMRKCRYVISTSSNVFVTLRNYRGSLSNMIVFHGEEVTDYTNEPYTNE